MPGLEDFYREKVSSFLKTIVCFDDEANFGCNSESKERDIIARKEEYGFSGETEDIAAIPPADKKDEESPVEKNFCLDAKALTDAFAQKAILCSVTKPSGEASVIENQIINLAQAADVLILDWFLADKDPAIAKNAIIKILAKDKESGGRLRLIVIYSVQPGNVVMDELDNILDSFNKSENGLQLRDEHTLIVFFQKPGTIKATQIVEYENLPQSVIDSFTKLSSGLLPAAALTAIAAIREQTHHLLATFPADLDAAFLTHRCLIPDPDDSELFLLDLLESEIGTLLRHSSVCECVNAGRCKSWVESKSLSEPEKQAILQALEFYHKNKIEKFRKMLGQEYKDENNIQTGDRVIEWLCRANQCTPQSAKEDLSILATIDVPRRHTSFNAITPPRLRLGAVVKNESGDYMICIQPLCDSVRISHSKDTIYPFLNLTTKNANDEKGIEICIPLQDGSVIWLGYTTAPKNITIYPFKGKSQTEAYVEGILSGNSFIFETSSENDNNLEWVAQLKIGKAQRIVSQLAARIHTLGIDEFEWMRLHQ